MKGSKKKPLAAARKATATEARKKSVDAMMLFGISAAHALAEAATVSDGSMLIGSAWANKLRDLHEKWRQAGNLLIELAKDDPRFVVEAVRASPTGDPVAFNVREAPEQP